jgi:putative hydrolase of the HAD superfamily
MMSRDDSGRQTLVLDAMGVIYEVGDDVADLLIPFIREKGGSADIQQIEAAYTEASLGRISAHEFWRRVSVLAELEDEYLSRFRLSNGLQDLLQTSSERFNRLVCLSNDLSQWSQKLRQRFGLERYFAKWYISGDLGVRKPDPMIYQVLLRDLAISASQLVFVDDRIKNLDPAAKLGIQTIHYNANRTETDGVHQVIDRLMSLVSD